jgi:hypothetical protein
MEITIPTHLCEVPLYKMVEYNSLPHLEENERAIKAVSIFLGLTNKETARLPLKVLNKAIEHIKNILSESPELQPTFEYKGIKYGFVPNLDDLTTGEFIDIETYQKEPKDTYKVLSVLYRPITKEGQGNRYLIAPYKGEINEAFREMPSPEIFGQKDAGSDENQFSKKWGWMGFVHLLAGGDVTKFGQVSELSIHTAFLWGAYKSDLAELERQIINKKR